MKPAARPVETRLHMFAPDSFALASGARRCSGAGHSGIHGTMLLACALAAAPAPAATYSVGETVDITTSGTLGTLDMDGGYLRLFALNPPQSLSTTDAVLGRGMISSVYAQSGLTTLRLLGLTQVPGAPAGPGVAAGMYLNASVFDSTGFDVINQGALVQTGTGEITLAGRARFVNDVSSTSTIKNDKGMALFTGSPTESSFLNKGTVEKSGSSGTSDINVPFNQEPGAWVLLYSGNLWLNQGGTHPFASFDADPARTNHGGIIGFQGTHSFDHTTTSAGRFQLGAGSTLNVVAGSVWQNEADFLSQGTIGIGSGAQLQNFGSFSNEGAINIATGAQFRNLGSGALDSSGTIVIAAGGQLRNAGVLTGTGGILGPGTLVNEPTGRIERTISSPTLDVINQGQFNVQGSDAMEVHKFENQAGTLRVDGSLTTGLVNNGGGLYLTGGVLMGNGLINGDVFIGGGVGTAAFRPGSSPGAMTINGNLSLLAGGVIDLDVEHLEGFSAPAADIIFVNGNVLLDGHINFLIGPDVVLDDELKLLYFIASSYGPIAYGSHFSVSFPGRTGALVAQTPGGLFITDLGVPVPVPEPHAYALMVAGLGLIGWRTMRRRHMH